MKYLHLTEYKALKSDPQCNVIKKNVNQFTNILQIDYN